MMTYAVWQVRSLTLSLTMACPVLHLRTQREQGEGNTVSVVVQVLWAAQIPTMLKESQCTSFLKTRNNEKYDTDQVSSPYFIGHLLCTLWELLLRTQVSPWSTRWGEAEIEIPDSSIDSNKRHCFPGPNNCDLTREFSEFIQCSQLDVYNSLVVWKIICKSGYSTCSFLVCSVCRCSI